MKVLGIFYFSNGDKFEGIFKNDLKESGTYTFSNGYSYTGNFLNDDFYSGTFKAPSGSSVVMNNGKVSCPHCHGKGIASKPIEQKLSWSTKDTYTVDRYGNRSGNYDGQSGGGTYSIPNYVACGRCGGKGYVCK